MRCTTRLAFVGAIVSCAGVAALAPLGAGDFAITSFTFDGGGGTSSGGAYVVSGTIGQFDAGPGSAGMSGGDFVLTGGFWHSVNDIKRPTCPADINDDLVVDVLDLLLALGAWGPCPGDCPPTCAADTNDDCAVDVIDMLAVLAAWGPCT
jgi:hypothetical protein